MPVSARRLIASALAAGALLVAGVLLAGCSSVATTDPASAQFRKHPEPVWRGHLLAGDPAVIRDGDRLLMYYTALTLGETDDDFAVLIGVAESADGIAWIFAKPVDDDNPESVALQNDEEAWDRILETSFVVRVEDEFLMYYTGYSEEVDGVTTIVAEGKIGVARSADGLSFERFREEPVLLPDAAYDSDGLFSPSVVRHDGDLHLIYAGWSLGLYGYGLFGATSPDGTAWTKEGDLLLRSSDVSWSIDNPREAEIVKAPGGASYYLFFTCDVEENLSAIGVARSAHPFGPWEVFPRPVVTATHDWEESGLVAPAVLIEDGLVRIWYMAETGGFSEFYIGYAEMDYPLDW